MNQRNDAPHSLESSPGAPAELVQPTSGGSNIASRLVAAVRILRERWWLIVIFVVVLGGAAYARSAAQPSMYAATSTLVYDPSNADRALSVNPAVGQVNQQSQSSLLQTVNLETIRQIATTPDVRASAAQQVHGIAGSTTVTATTNLQTNLLNITVSARNRTAAAALANAWAKTLVTERTHSYRASFTDAITLVQHQLARPQRLSKAVVAGLDKQLQLLRLAAALQQGDLVLAQLASVPSHRSSPNPVAAAVLGAGLGLLLAILALALIEALDRRIKRFDDVVGAWGAPLLAVIPPLSPQPPNSMFATVGALESFRALQTSLIFAGSRFEHPQVIVVTSATPKEGKSVVALGLAGTLARTGSRVLLIDADYRHPSVTTTLGIEGPGFSSAIAGTEALSDLVASRGTKREHDDNDIPDDGSRFDCIGCGVQPPDPLRLLSSPRVAELLGRARQEWDHIVIDCPPLLPVSDTVPLIPQADGVLVCARLNHSRFDTVRRAREIVERMRGSVMGVALAAPKRTLGYGYGYGYGYGSPNGHGRVTQEGQPQETERTS